MGAVLAVIQNLTLNSATSKLTRLLFLKDVLGLGDTCYVMTKDLAL
jgi:hypothetical protein